MKSISAIPSETPLGTARIRPSTPWRHGRPGRASIAAAAALLFALVTGSTLALRTTAPQASSSPGFFDNFDGLQLLDQDGRAFQRAGLDGRIVLLNFVFTGCAATCPTQTRELAALQQALPAPLRREVRFLSISVDPLGDTPALLRAYGQAAGADFSSWTFATGRPPDIERLGERLRMFRNGAVPGRPEDHLTSLWLIDGHGRLMQRYSGTGFDVTRLSGELARLRDLAVGSRRAS